MRTRRGAVPDGTDRRRGMAVGLLGALAALVAPLALAAPSLGAGSPTPIGDPFPGVELWLDQPFVPSPGAAAGGTLAVAATFWDLRQHEPWAISGVYVRLYPAKGRAEPVTVAGESDWPGHLVADVTIPKGGAGRLELGTRAQQCAADGTCSDLDIPFPIAGAGPPASAPRSALVKAELSPIQGPVVAGQPVDVSVTVTPLGRWDASVLGLPDQLVVIATHPGTSDRDRAELQGTDATPAVYGGRLTVRAAGEAILTAAFPGSNGQDQRIAGELGRLIVREGGEASGGAAATPAGVVPTPAGSLAIAEETGSPPAYLVAAAALLVVALVLIVVPMVRRR